MLIRKSEFVTSAARPEQYPGDGLPHIVMVGKSNVGKSSLINQITNNSKLARVSSQPGKTRLINFYKVNDQFYLVDLPGYGFARVSKNERELWARMIENYLKNVSNITLFIQLVDIRHSPTVNDQQMVNWIQHYMLPVVIAATKADKIGKTRWSKHIKMIRNTLGISDKVPVFPVSTISDAGKDELLTFIGTVLEKYQ